MVAALLIHAIVEHSAIQAYEREWPYLCSLSGSGNIDWESLERQIDCYHLRGLVEPAEENVGVVGMRFRRGHGKAAVAGMVHLARRYHYTVWLSPTREFDPVIGWTTHTTSKTVEQICGLGWKYLCITTDPDFTLPLKIRSEAGPFVREVGIVRNDGLVVSIAVALGHTKAGLRGMMHLSRKYGYRLVFDHGRRFDPDKGWIHKRKWETNPYTDLR